MKISFASLALCVLVSVSLTPYPAFGDVQYLITGLDMVRASGVDTHTGEIQIVGVDQPPGSLFQGAWQTLGGGRDFMGTLPGGVFSEAFAVQDGIAVGSSHVVGLDGLDRVRAFMYNHSGGNMTSLDNVSDLSEAFGLNDRYVVGTADFGTGIVTRPTLWDRTTNTMTAIGNVMRGSANAINNNDQVVGNVVHDDGSGVRQAFRLLNGLDSNAELLNIPNAFESVARDINDTGDTVGFYVDIDTGARHAFICRVNGTLEFPGALGGSSNTLNCINGNGLAGGQFLSASGPHAYLFDPVLGPLDLASLIDPASGWVPREITGITDEGYLVGYGTDPQGLSRGFVAIPVPGPGTGVGLVAFAAFANTHRRRR